jgi:competence protein ComEA
MTLEYRTVATAWGGSEASVAAPDDGGGNRSPAAHIGRLGRTVAALRQSPWAAVALRCAAILVGMSLLSAIGALSIKKSLEGSALLGGALGRGQLATHLNAEWLAPAAVPQAPAVEPAAPPAEVPAEARAAPEQQPGCDKPPASTGVTADGKVILNEASVQELTRLPGIGQRRAEQIVELRTRLKRFKRLSDLLRVRGIGPRALKRLKPHVVLDAPREPAAAGASQAEQLE